MSIPRWKVWLSYLFEFHIESTSSTFNPHLYVSFHKGRYQLSTANAVYSFGDLYTNFSRTFEQWHWDTHAPKNVLLLGLGLGSIPVIIEQIHQHSCRFTAVEIDEEVVDLAYRYVLSQLDNPVEMIIADAQIAVAQLPRSSYDLVCVDIFDDDTVPPQFETTAFLSQAAELLQDDGILLFNRLAANRSDRKLSETFYKHTFQKVFPNACCLDVGGNYMLVSNRKAIQS